MASTNLEIVISAKDQFSGTADRIVGKLNGINNAVGRTGKGFGQLAGGLARVGAVGFTALGGGLAYVAKQAIDFEDAFAGVRKTVNETELAAAGLTFDSLARSFRDMATEIPIAATELAAIGETAGALGIAAGDITEFTRVVALMGVTTNLTTEQASQDLGKLGTILNLTGDDFEELADSIVALGNAGASTETEIVDIAKRFAGAGKQAGLLKEDIVALASATASLGIEPEAAGGALSRLFNNMTEDIALATEAGQEFSRLTGKSLETLEERIRKGDGLSIFLKVIEEIGKLDPIQASRTLDALGITNTRDKNALLLMAQEYGVVTSAINTAKTANNALTEEAEKRFDTVASKLKLLKQGFVEAAITVGEGFAPAIGRAAEKLSAFLKDPAGKASLKQFGEDIGKFIDDIDWAEVLDGARTFISLLKDAATFAKSIVDVLAKLPPEVLAAGLGLVGLNKLSGGLIGAGLGNIAGGIGETVVRSAGASLPGAAGKLFAQPVFVTNWPIGMGLGGSPTGGAGGGSSLLGNALKTAAKITIVGTAGVVAAEVAGVTRDSPNREVNSIGNITRTVTDVNQKLADLLNVQTALQARAAAGDTFAQTQLAAVEAEIARVRGEIVASKTVAQQGFGGLSQDERETARKVQEGWLALHAASSRQLTATDRTKDDIVRATQSSGNLITTTVNAAKSAIKQGVDAATLAARHAGQQTAAAIKDKDLSVKVTVPVNVTTRVSVAETIKSQTTFKQYGGWVAS